MIDNIALLLQNLTGYQIFGGNELESGYVLLFVIVSLIIICPIITCCSIILQPFGIVGIILAIILSAIIGAIWLYIAP